MFSNDISHTFGYVVCLILHVMLTWTLNVNLILAQLSPSSNRKILSCAFGKPGAGSIISLFTNILTRIEVQGQKHTDGHKENQKERKAESNLMPGTTDSLFSCCLVSLAASFMATLVLLSPRCSHSRELWGQTDSDVANGWMNYWSDDFDTEETEGTQTCLATTCSPVVCCFYATPFFCLSFLCPIFPVFVIASI